MGRKIFLITLIIQSYEIFVVVSLKLFIDSMTMEIIHLDHHLEMITDHEDIIHKTKII